VSALGAPLRICHLTDRPSISCAILKAKKRRM
jgi:hypothetical protein